MIKFFRESALTNVWLHRGVILFIALAFVVTMGWSGFQSPATQRVVATAGEVTITIEQYQRAYANAHRFYRDLLEDDFSEEMLEQMDLKRTVVNGMVERQLWLAAAEQMDLKVSDQELSDHVSRQEQFQRDGVFDPAVYRRLLSRNQLTPKQFEDARRNDLRVSKAKNLILSVAIVTPQDLQEMKVQLESSEDPEAMDSQRLTQSILLQKQQLVLDTYLNTLRSKIPVTIHENML